jgi:hypothetical protein
MLMITEKIIEWLLLGWSACALAFLSDCYFFGVKYTSKTYTQSIIVMTILFGPFSFLLVFISWYRLWKGRHD